LIHFSESDPKLTGGPANTEQIALENENITYTCAIKYKGKWAPVMQWKDLNGSIITHTNQNTPEETKSMITVQATVARDGQQYRCLTNFGTSLNPAPGADEAQNIPSYQNTQTSGTLIVHCKLTVIESMYQKLN
jgi:hypothetical protein